MISGKRVASAKGARGLRPNQLPPTPIPRGCLIFVRNNDHDNIYVYAMTMRGCRRSHTTFSESFGHRFNGTAADSTSTSLLSPAAQHRPVLLANDGTNGNRKVDGSGCDVKRDVAT